MSTTVQKWGNSLGIRIPAHIADKIEVRQGTEVELIVSDDRKLIIVPQKKKPTLEELLEKCKPENRHDEIDFGREGTELI
ncbi:AbrB/MazE/SpoVT family DNA-binding domain-containing protein [Paenibacillus barcinonensis]|jgi:antitoxin MazE|uniref:AbrB/MazE/SpoVT family DNA-binding domain-containing protein n=1 Tax=Paenibacillus barcinonensis TaxID=198119 RepID=UPI001C10242D|nr:AbrB/MazE/SpoVT family DNA-binding domain-containing protein [Paenibacillus barcinonensis]MBU5355244.1 AbrB/MazE/SpoVT family DNA-binding domain-containing protein [Paenibacillus barcinonensis]